VYGERSLWAVPSYGPDKGGRASDAEASAADLESQAWVDGLRTSGAQYYETVSRLWSLLLRAARHEVRRREALLEVSGPELNDIAHQAANDALVAILGRIDDFRGESRFTTWAYKFVLYEVSVKMGRHFWRQGKAALYVADWELLACRLVPLPQQHVELQELLGVLRRAVEEDLTERQRKVFVAIVLNEVPVDALTHEFGSNRNAIYKVLFDARRKLRASLARAGYALDEMQE
jgi:RNA polymerase sigma-70 factor (ECF subfamily)